MALSLVLFLLPVTLFFIHKMLPSLLRQGGGSQQGQPF